MVSEDSGTPVPVPGSFTWTNAIFAAYMAVIMAVRAPVEWRNLAGEISLYIKSQMMGMLVARGQ